MKLRRSLVTVAATAALAPVVLLAAPAAFAEESGSPSPTGSASQSAASPAASDGSGASGPASGSSSAASTPEQDDLARTPSTPASGSASGSPSGSPSPSASGAASPSPSAGEDETPFDPYEDCRDFELDKKLKARITGLPSKIVAGSGWHDFTFEVENNSAEDLKDVYLDTYLEYADDSDVWLSEGLAVLQVEEDGKWTNGYQDSYEDEHGDTVNVTGSFVALLDSLEKDTSATFDLRVKVKASAPAGSSFAMSEAVYADDDETCHVTDDFYDVRILAAGGDAGDAGDAKPGGHQGDGPRPQGGPARTIDGSLAETGTSSALPVIALVGGVAVVAGAGAVIAVRRRRPKA
ncbi:hypothetical protein JCM4814A_21920 [Streptomyces phaeofaciens JCM 4814]|uniref:Gram-positive cocci surface proteins LPxTG domain-containing protein n=1 Tax=Streptomyces phaeofaciens TaxID=68254 RepID=A0A918H2Q5_9ACTN|nr:LAETG motif-containing sortase-dependent surface protein [Streptomyces phaeofaciens]GGT33866.1 hypothetical protein GCM10010226_07270 [Streptomyces phaeofaciens]